jgi:signal peptidase I
MATPRLRSAAWIVAGLGAALAFWCFLAPAQLGGRTSYVVVHGTSMEPHLHEGDLVLLRRRETYGVGQIVGYRSRQLGRNVLHRIVDIRGDRYSFKGDNNDFVDPEHPTADRLFGREWIVLPRLGSGLERLRSPLGIALLAAVSVLLLGMGGTAETRRRRSSAQPRRNAPGPEPARREPPPRTGSGSSVSAVGLALALAGIGVLGAALLLGAASARHPTRRTVVDPALYVQRGAFSYSAEVPVGAVYQRPVLSTSEPVFLRLVHDLRVRFAYRVRSERPSGFAGTARLDAVLADGSGWRRVLPLAPARRFTGTKTALGGTLDLDAVRGEIGRFERTTGEQNTTYRLELVPRVSLRGVVDGRPVRNGFAPALAFDLDELKLQLARPDDAGAATSLVRTKAVAGTDTAAATIGFAGRQLEVGRARVLALELGVAGLLALIGGGALFAATRRRDPLASIQRRYGDAIVPVAGAAPSGPERVVPSMEALAQIAESYERVVLHERRGDRDVFLVEEGGLVYRYDVPDEDPGYRIDLPDLPDSPEAATQELRYGWDGPRGGGEGW